MSVHTVPMNDEREHVLSAECWCEPRVLWTRVEWTEPDTGLPRAAGGAIIVHNSADCRELGEIDEESAEPGKEWEVIHV